MNTTKVEVFCPHCNESVVVQFARSIDAPVMSVQPRFDRTIENVNPT
jgi:hypothetical protein